MKNIMSKTVLAGMMATAAGLAHAEEEGAANTAQETTVSVTADLASAYVFRGATLNDGVVFQPGIEVSGFGLQEGYGSITVGVWGNYDFNDYAPAGAVSSSSQETDWYGSYGLPQFVEGLDLFIGYTEYTYGAGSSDKEVNVGAGYELAGIALGLTYYQGVGGNIGTQAYIEAAIGYALELSDALSASVDATAAYLDPSTGGSSGFNDYSIGASAAYALTDTWSVGGSLTYIGQGDDAVLSDASYDVSVLGVLSVGASF